LLEVSKAVPLHTMEALVGRESNGFYSFMTSALYGGGWSLSCRGCHFSTRERTPGTQWIGGWVGGSKSWSECRA
jgi:hypothetical protein